MVWNHRVIRHDEGGETWYAIHEVFYEDPEDDSTASWTLTEIPPVGDSLENLRLCLQRMLMALDKPVLVIKDGKPTHE